MSIQTSRYGNACQCAPYDTHMIPIIIIIIIIIIIYFNDKLITSSTGALKLDSM